VDLHAPEALKSTNDYLIELKRQRELIEQSTPTWPVRLPALRGLSLAALLPLISGLITIGKNVIASLPK